MQQGKLIIFSAPSGSGKSTIVNALIERGIPLEFSISATSRLPRGSEKDGVHYYFLSPESFNSKVENNLFLEWEEVYDGKYYGTLSSEVDRIWSKSKHVIFDVDVNGGINLKSKFGDRALSIFIHSPSIDVLKSRLKSRNTESQRQLNIRLKKAEYEISFAKDFDLIIMNDRLDLAIEQAYEKVTQFLHGY
jgi:guanylate kinase